MRTRTLSSSEMFANTNTVKKQQSKSFRGRITGVAGSIPACNSADLPKCLKAETAAAQKLQADMDKHDKDYFVPNFGVDHDIITTQNNFKKAGGKLAQKQSIPACNSSDFPKCLKAET